MNKTNVFKMLLFCGIFLWLIPSCIFYEVDKKIVLFYFGFHLIISILYMIQLLKVFKNKRNLEYEGVLIYLSVLGSLVLHIGTYVALLTQGEESNIKIIPWVLALRGVIVISIIIVVEL